MGGKDLRFDGAELVFPEMSEPVFGGEEAGGGTGEDEGGYVCFEHVREDFGPVFGGEAWGFRAMSVVEVMGMGLELGGAGPVDTDIPLVILVSVHIGRPVPKYADPLVKTILPRQLRQPLVLHQQFPDLSLLACRLVRETCVDEPRADYFYICVAEKFEAFVGLRNRGSRRCVGGGDAAGVLEGCGFEEWVFDWWERGERWRGRGMVLSVVGGICSVVVVALIRRYWRKDARCV